MLVVVGCVQDKQVVTTESEPATTEPVASETQEEPVAQETTSEPAEEVEAVEPQEEERIVVNTGSSHVVEMTTAGFDVDELSVRVGDTVAWVNNRQEKINGINNALVLGTFECRGIKSGIIKLGESYTYTFEEALDCEVVDGIFTEEKMRVVVE